MVAQKHCCSLPDAIFQALDTGPILLLMLDLEYKITHLNSSFSNRTGFTLKDLSDNPFSCLTSVNAPEPIEPLWKDLEQGRAWSGEGQLRKCNSELYWAQVSISPVADGEKSACCYLVVIQDVTSQKEAGIALREKQSALEVSHQALQELFEKITRAKREWEQIIDCVDDLLVYVDPDQKIIRSNSAFAAFVGQSVKELIGKPVDLLFDQFGVEFEYRDRDCCHLYHDASQRWFAFKTYPLILANELRGKVVVVQDISEIKHANQALEEANAQLKQSQSTILQQEKMASVGQLAAGVAHEINNPMGFITSNLSSLQKYTGKLTDYLGQVGDLVGDHEALQTEIKALKKKAKLDFLLEDIEDLLAESMEGAERVKEIVQGLKSFSRVDQAEEKPEDLNACLETTIRMVWNEIKYRASLDKDYADLPLVKCNAQQLNQVFVNLLVNAAQAIKEGGEGKIQVRTRAQNDAVFIDVQDNGCGIPKENQSRIFEPFFSTKEVGKGTGLGMSIAYDIVKSHGGEISLDSTPGEGTTFTVAIPIRQ